MLHKIRHAGGVAAYRMLLDEGRLVPAEVLRQGLKAGRLNLHHGPIGQYIELALMAQGVPVEPGPGGMSFVDFGG